MTHFAQLYLLHWDEKTKKGALDLGQSLVVDADIGVGASTRNAFLASFETVKKTLQPTPLCLLVAGVATNRSGGGSDPLLGVRGNLVNMTDAPLKVKLEGKGYFVGILSVFFGIFLLYSLYIDLLKVYVSPFFPFLKSTSRLTGVFTGIFTFDSRRRSVVAVAEPKRGRGHERNEPD